MIPTEVLLLAADKNAITLLPTSVQIVIGSLLILCAVFLTIAVLLQEGKSSKLSGAIAGGSDSPFGKTKSKKMSDTLSKATTIVAIVFVVIVVLLAIMNRELFLPNLGNVNGTEPTETESVSKTSPTEEPTESPATTPSETPAVTPSETPAGTPSEAPVETPTETPAGTPSEAPVESAVTPEPSAEA